MSAAVVTMIQGKSYALREGQEKYLAVHSELHVSDTVRTEADAKLVMRFADGATVHLGPSSRVAIKDFLYDPQGGNEPSFALDMLAGAVRSVSGKVVEQNPEAFKLKAPLGTVGIRGTTTLHLIYGDREVHIVESLDKGHTVVITTPDGRSITLTLSSTGVTIMSEGLDPLVLEQISPGRLQEILREWLEEGNVSQLMESFLTTETAAFIAKLADLYIKGQLDIAGLRDSTDLTSSLSGEFGGLSSFSLVSGTDDFGDLSGDSLVTSALGGDMDAGPGGPINPGGPTVTTIVGSPYSNDWLIGTPGNDLMYGYSGDDFFWTGAGNDTVYGGYGSSDTIVKPGVMAAGSVLCGDEDILPAGATADSDVIIIGAAPSVTSLGDSAAPYDDTVSYGPGNMTGGVIYGNARVMEAGSFADSLGGNSITVQGEMSGGVIYGDAQTAGNGVTLGNDTVTVRTMSGGTIYADAASYGSGVISGANTIGVLGTMSGGAIYGGNGGDKITVGGSMSGGAIYGGGGFDSITVGNMSGGVIDGMGGGDGEGGDHITVTGSFTGGTIHYHAGDNLSIASWSGNGTLFLGNEGNNFIWEAFDGGIILGGAGNDGIDVYGMGGGTIDGGAGNDSITVWEAYDDGIILGGAGNDSIAVYGMAGGTIDGGAGDDSIAVYGMTGGTIDGGADNDSITVYGDMTGGIIDGGAGTDSITVTGAFNGGTIRIGATDVLNVAYYGGGWVELKESMNFNHSTLSLNSGGVQGSAYADTITLNALGGTAAISGGDGNDSINVTAMSGGIIDGGDGNDSISVTTMNGGVIDGGAGTNIITVGAFNSGTIRVGATDVLTYGSIGGSAVVELKENTIQLAAWTGGTLHGDDSDNVIGITTLSGGVVDAGAGNDTINVTTITGGSIYGGAGKDSLSVSATASGSGNAEAVFYGTINMGEGDDSISVSATTSGSGNAYGVVLSTIGMGEGDDSIEISATANGYATAYDTAGAYGIADSAVNTGAGNDSLSISATTHGDGVATGVFDGTSINMGDGDDSLSISATSNSGEVIVLRQQFSVISIDMGAGNDTISISATSNSDSGVNGTHCYDHIRGITIDMGDGDDSISISIVGGTSIGLHGAVIDMGDGDDSFSINAVANNGTAVGMQYVAIDMCDGDDSININAAGNNGDAYGMSDETYINMGDGNDSICISVAASSTWGSARGINEYGSTISIDMGAGNDSICIRATASENADAYGIYCSYNPRCTIDMGDGDDSISISATTSGNGSAYAVSGSTIDMGDGNDSLYISATSGSGAAYAVSNSTIDLGAGDDTCTINGVMLSGTILSGAGNDVITIATLGGGATGDAGVIDLSGGVAGDSKTVQIDNFNWAGNNLTLTCGNGADSITISGINGSLADQALTINDFNGLYDIFNISEFYGSHGWTWTSSGNAASWTITAVNGSTTMVTITINGTNLDNLGAIVTDNSPGGRAAPLAADDSFALAEGNGMASDAVVLGASGALSFADDVPGQPLEAVGNSHALNQAITGEDLSHASSQAITNDNGSHASNQEISGTVVLFEDADSADWNSFCLNGQPLVFDSDGKATVSTEFGEVSLTNNNDNTVSYSYAIPADAPVGGSYSLRFSIADLDGDLVEADTTYTVESIDPPDATCSVEGIDPTGAIHSAEIDPTGATYSAASIVPANATLGAVNIDPTGAAYSAVSIDPASTENFATDSGPDAPDGLVWSAPRIMVFNMPDGFGSISMDAVELVDRRPLTITGPHMTLKATLELAADGKSGLVEYYRLLSGPTHDADAGHGTVEAARVENFTLVMTNLAGGTSSTSIAVSPIDRVPSCIVPLADDWQPLGAPTADIAPPAPDSADPTDMAAPIDEFLHSLWGANGLDADAAFSFMLGLSGSHAVPDIFAEAVGEALAARFGDVFQSHAAAGPEWASINNAPDTSVSLLDPDANNSLLLI